MPTLTGWSAPSEEELENQGGEFAVLAEDEYIAKVRSIEVKSMANNFPSKGDNEPMHDMISVSLEVLTFADGEDLVDENGDTPDEPVYANVLLNPKKVGMVPQPSKTRKFFAAVLGQNLGDPIEIASFDDLIGKQVIATVKNNKGYNNGTDFRALKKNRVRATTPKGPVDGEELKRRVRAVADEDAPSNRTELSVNSDDLDF